MDVPPNQLIRLLQLGQVEKALHAQAIWQCVSCQTCSTRCPKKVDCAGVMDALREVAIRRNAAAPGCHRVIAFQQAFLENVRRYGRLNEVEMTVAFKQKTFLRDRNLMLLMQGGGLAPELMKRHKFHLRGEKVRDRGLVGRIFARCTEDAR
jgi:heterodisulfide reductase subunit C